MARGNRNIETNEQLIDRTLRAITSKNTELNARKDTAISVFRNTANELKFVNEGLAATAKVADEMVTFFATHKENTEKAIAENAAVAARILEIIGE